MILFCDIAMKSIIETFRTLDNTVAVLLQIYQQTKNYQDRELGSCGATGQSSRKMFARHL